MGLLNKVGGPKSKYDKSLPYTYRAEVRELPDNDEVTSDYFSDTLCGLLDYLRDNKIDPESVFIFGIYQKKDVLLNTNHCVGSNGKWLERPEICQAMEDKYRETLNEIYRGHVDKGNCEFEDRDREGMGPN